MGVKAADDACMSADEWQSAAQLHEGSWWPAWQNWLARHSSAKRVPPPSMGIKGRALLGDAPGSYVMQR
jgi:polyhydroxyalkanoate synthase